jgi:hypothetical protein
MNNKLNCLASALLICLSGFLGSAYGEDAQTLPGPMATPAPAPEPTVSEPTAPEPTGAGPTAPESTVASPAAPEPSAAAPTAPGPAAVQSFPGQKISLAPFPVVIYLLDKQKPTVAISTPCIQMEKMTNGFPPFMAFENFMFNWIGDVNESDILPFRIEPVCI